MKLSGWQLTFCSAAIALPLSLAAQTPQYPPPGQYPQSGNPNNAANAQARPGNAGMQDSSQNETSRTDPQMIKDKMFVHAATEGGFAEVQFGQLAVQKGSTDEVRKFGQRMVDDHKVLNDQMKPVADELGVRIPTKMNKDDQAEYDKLSALSGADFDKEYLTFMVRDHRKDLHAFHTEGEATTDVDLKPVVESGQRLIAQHLFLVASIAKANGIVVPRTPQASR